MTTIFFTDEQCNETVTLLQEARDRAIEDIDLLLDEMKQIPGDPEKMRGPEFLNLAEQIRYRQNEISRIQNIFETVASTKAGVNKISN